MSMYAQCAGWEALKAVAEPACLDLASMPDEPMTWSNVPCLAAVTACKHRPEPPTLVSSLGTLAPRCMAWCAGREALWTAAERQHRHAAAEAPAADALRHPSESPTGASSTRRPKTTSSACRVFVGICHQVTGHRRLHSGACSRHEASWSMTCASLTCSCGDGCYARCSPMCIALAICSGGGGGGGDCAHGSLSGHHEYSRLPFAPVGE